MVKLLYVLIGITGVLLSSAVSATAEDSRSGSAAKDVKNPISSFISFQIENQYYGDLKGKDSIPHSKHNGINAAFLRFVSPFEIGGTNWVQRTTLPIVTSPVGHKFSNQTAIGDLNIIAAYLLDLGNPALNFGIGPQLTIPTATKKRVGTQKWQGGLTNVLYSSQSKLIQWGYLLTWQASFAGKKDRKSTSVGQFQPFGFLQIGKGWYIRSDGIWTYDFKTDHYFIPVGLGLGRVFPVSDKLILNVFAEPQYSVKRHGIGMPRWGLYAGIDFNIKH